MSKRPQPIVTEQVCSLCGLDWHLHGDKPSPTVCIDLLRAELAMRPRHAPLPQPSPWLPHNYDWWNQPYAPTIVWSNGTAAGAITELTGTGPSWQEDEE